MIWAKHDHVPAHGRTTITRLVNYSSGIQSKTGGGKAVALGSKLVATHGNADRLASPSPLSQSRFNGKTPTASRTAGL